MEHFSQWSSADGRVGRATFWVVQVAAWFSSFVWLVGVTLTGRGWVILTEELHQPILANLLVILLALLWAVFIAGLWWIAVVTAVKRCHDRGLSGLWLLAGISLIGGLWLLVELGLLPGTYGPNRYGDGKPVDMARVARLERTHRVRPQSGPWS